MSFVNASMSMFSIFLLLISIFGSLRSNGTYAFNLAYVCVCVCACVCDTSKVRDNSRWESQTGVPFGR